MGRRGAWPRVVVCFALLGIVAMVRSASAIAVSPGPRLAVGAEHACAVTVSDTVKCWGRNNLGQLGNASIAQTTTESNVPISVDALPGGRVARSVAAGTAHTCVLANDGSVWCWGSGSSGQLGRTLFGDESSPVRAQTTGTVAAIAAGGNNTCAVISDGTLQCWGANSYGQLGVGASGPSSSAVPVTVNKTPFGGSHLNSFSAVQVAVGATAVCALSAVGTVWCWGDNRYAAVGNTSPGTVYEPTPVAMTGTASRVSMGVDHACAMLDGVPTCWGRNYHTQLTSPYNAAVAGYAPMTVAFAGTIVSVHAVANAVCAVDSSGTASCRGGNNMGQLSSTSATRQSSIVAYGGVSGVVGVSGTAATVCVDTTAGSVWCAGDNQYGQTGDSDMLSPSSPAVQVAGIDVSTTTTTTTAASTTAPPSSSTPTTTAASTTSSIPTTTAAPTTSSTPTTTAAPTTSSTPATSSTSTTIGSTVPSAATAAGVVVRSLTVKRGRRISARRIAAAVGLAVPKRSQGTMRLSITRGAGTCRFVGSSVLGVRRGRCTVAVVLMPRKGRSTLRRTTIAVT